MAISIPSDSAASARAAHTHPVDVESWAEHAIAHLTISEPPPAAGTGGSPLRDASVSLSIPLDAPGAEAKPRKVVSEEKAMSSAYSKSGQLARRDSLKRREALLKGREGSRRRQRWENGE